ncbi:hypothetical protein [Pectobacterium parmentieri]|uniref:hypothetical protein n=1 Tax=Pectobacterium parmentieri TaxID=1905730 RepID=UPI000CDCFB52|nr:hypothetical protein [Pectobacterium parmentieri]AYH04271.1 hypothetical protein C5E25_02070 [Pectobacterium parmentieri]AYH13092.1 hypothetical protein C5E23_02055 [Pectobacterium parmentieri]AYH21794.1 hypothetical protein C5E21_02050 [Pectobacterium parmentieri]MBI0552808.1 hypothetical protein [Pectobacterium parmentieri]MBI0561828.1 hypothetical protein [Pectobacterium parmentieri]
MLTVNNQAIETIYGEIHGRDALILKNVMLNMYPMEIEVITSLDLSFCQPNKGLSEEVLACFKFKNIKLLNITMIDESKYQLVKKSCFDKILDEEKDEHYILSTYDHVFDVVGQCEVSYK